MAPTNEAMRVGNKQMGGDFACYVIADLPDLPEMNPGHDREMGRRRQQAVRGTAAVCDLSGFASGVLRMFAALVYPIDKLVLWNNSSVGIAPLVIGLFFPGSVQQVPWAFSASM